MGPWVVVSISGWLTTSQREGDERRCGRDVADEGTMRVKLLVQPFLCAYPPRPSAAVAPASPSAAQAGIRLHSSTQYIPPQEKQIPKSDLLLAIRPNRVHDLGTVLELFQHFDCAVERNGQCNSIISVLRAARAQGLQARDKCLAGTGGTNGRRAGSDQRDAGHALPLKVIFEENMHTHASPGGQRARWCPQQRGQSRQRPSWRVLGQVVRGCDCKCNKKYCNVASMHLTGSWRLARAFVSCIFRWCPDELPVPLLLRPTPNARSPQAGFC